MKDKILEKIKELMRDEEYWSSKPFDERHNISTGLGIEAENKQMADWFKSQWTILKEFVLPLCENREV